MIQSARSLFPRSLVQRDIVTINAAQHPRSWCHRLIRGPTIDHPLDPEHVNIQFWGCRVFEYFCKLFKIPASQGKGFGIRLNETKAGLLMYTRRYLSNQPAASPRAERLVFKQFFATDLGMFLHFRVQSSQLTCSEEQHTLWSLYFTVAGEGAYGSSFLCYVDCSFMSPWKMRLGKQACFLQTIANSALSV